MAHELLAHLRPEFTAKLDRFAGDKTHVDEGVLRGAAGAGGRSSAGAVLPDR